MSGHGDEHSTSLIFYVNGRKIIEEQPDPEETLLKYLRRKLLLTGVKESCGQGACGSCTIMVSYYNRSTKLICNEAVTACLVPVCSLHGKAVTTVEGIGSVNTKLHPVQEELVRAHGTQCGYCTPGFVMSMYTLLRNNSKPSQAQVHTAIKGNLCRCTGYRPILDGFKPFTQEYCALGEACCKRTSTQSGDITASKIQDERAILKYDPSQDPIFPSQLQLSDALDVQTLRYSHGPVTWHRPTTLRQLLRLKSQYPGAKIQAGNTTLGLQRNHGDQHYSVLLCITEIPELLSITHTDTGIKVGAGVTLSRLEMYIDDLLGAGDSSAPKYRGLLAIKNMLENFAALQVKNVVTIGGCVASAWSNSDVIPLLCSLGATLHLDSHSKGACSTELSGGYFHGSGRTDLADHQIITHVTLPYNKQNEYVFTIKESHRDFDTAIISTAGVVSCDQLGIITAVSIHLGNLLPAVYKTDKLINGIIGKSVSLELLTEALTYLQQDFIVIDQQRTSPLPSHLRSLTEASIWKLMLQLVKDVLGHDEVPTDLLHSLDPLHTGFIKGTQVYEEVPSDQPLHDAVGRPIVHRAARQQATGEAMYMDDTPSYQNELHMAFVTSLHAHARIVEVDLEEALKVTGVVDILTYKDVPGSNMYGVGVQDDPIFAEHEVICYGQVIAAVIATSREIAQRAVKLVHVTYDKLPAIFTIQDAIAASSYHTGCPSLDIGDVEAGMKESHVIIEGDVETGGQEHFYMETFRALAVASKEDEEIALYVPMQNPNLTQMTTANVLNISYNKVGVHIKRAGGGFGGKETRLTVLLATAVASYKHKCAVRCVLDRDEDMQLTGGRNPTLTHYKVGVKKTGELVAVDLDYYLNGGCTADATPFVASEMYKLFDNSYRMPNVRLRATACKTNLPSATGFRGYGKPQSMFITETMMQHVAEYLHMDPVKLREVNMYHVGDVLPLNCSSETLTIERCWNQLITSCNYHQRLHDVQQFNSVNKYRKRGISIGPLKYGLPYPPLQLNQGTALVNIYLDGTVLVHHGGMEMGQGLHTKVIQIASRALGVPVDSIHISETNTDIIQNASTTGGSSTTDVMGGAVMNACETLVERIQPYKAAKPDGAWVEWINAAYMNRVSLSAAGAYKIGPDNVGYDFATGQGIGYVYFSCGAACTEVEVDMLTGHHAMRRVDITMDVGRSLNPAIDIGQIEGGFLQGYGMHGLEQLKYDNNGKITTSNALGYKIPCASNLPAEFNVSLLKDAPNPKAVYSSKGIGEPPFVLAYTVHLAIRDAVRAYRHQHGNTGHFQLNSPATPDLVRGLCPCHA